MLLQSLEFFFFTMAFASILYYLGAMIAARSFFAAKAILDTGALPPVSILIPLCGADFGAYENYASLCRQDYPRLQLVFGVRDIADSSIGLIAKLKADFPLVEIDLAVNSEEIGENPKVSNLNNILSLARHDFLMLMDSDIRVGPDFLRSVLSEMIQTGAGVVTCLYRAGEAPGLAAKLEAVGISAEFAPGVLIAEKTAGISFAFGAAILIEKNTLAAIGGFVAIADYLADDYMIGNLASKAGYPVRLSNYVVETVLSRLDISGFIKHQVRWARGIRACNRAGHTGSLITNGTVLAAFYLALSGFSATGWVFFAMIAALRLAMALFIGVKCLGDKPLKLYLPLILIRDFFSFYFWCAAIFGDCVEWRGRIFKLTAGGKMVRQG